MDLDDLYDQKAGNARVQRQRAPQESLEQNRFQLRQDAGNHAGNQQNQGRVEVEDDWGDLNVSSQQKNQYNQNQGMGMMQQQMPPVIDDQDEWGDLGSNQKKQSEEKKLEIQPEYKQNQRKQEIEDEWACYSTPAAMGGNKKMALIAEQQVKSRKQEEDEDDDWGDIQGFQMKAQQQKPLFASSNGTKIIYQKPTGTKMGGTKCYPLCVGGASLKMGCTQDSMQPMSCSSLKCYNCDKKVHRFINASWHASVDYLFVRNYNTDIEQLKTGLKYDPGFSSYACQCQFRSFNSVERDICEDLKWMCGGH